MKKCKPRSGPLSVWFAHPYIDKLLRKNNELSHRSERGSTVHVAIVGQDKGFTEMVDENLRTDLSFHGIGNVASGRHQRAAEISNLFVPDLVILCNATEEDLAVAQNVPEWKGLVICVADDDGRSDHHSHRDGVHHCDLSNLQDVVSEVLRSNTKVAPPH